MAESKVKNPGGPAMVHFKQVKSIALTPITANQGALASMKTIVHSNVAGKQMQAGIFGLEPGKPFTFTYCYESIVLVLNGQFTVKHIGKDSYTLTAGDNMYIRAGTQLQYTAGAANSRLYYVIQPPQAEDCGRIQAGICENPAPTVLKNLPSVDDLPLLPNDFQAKAYLKDILMSTIPGKELTSGLYRIYNGPAHDYVYDYEEFKYIVEGQLNLRDGTGQCVEAKAGDLMYFPDGTFINFGCPESGGCGFFVGQRLGGTA